MSIGIIMRSMSKCRIRGPGTRASTKVEGTAVLRTRYDRHTETRVSTPTTARLCLDRNVPGACRKREARLRATEAGFSFKRQAMEGSPLIRGAGMPVQVRRSYLV